MSYTRILRKDFSFHDVDVSSRDIFNDAKEGIDQPKSVKHEEEKDNYHEKDEDESSIKMNYHQINDLLGFITSSTFGYFVKAKKWLDHGFLKVFVAYFAFLFNFRSRVPCEMQVHPPSYCTVR